VEGSHEASLSPHVCRGEAGVRIPIAAGGLRPARPRVGGLERRDTHVATLVSVTGAKADNGTTGRRVAVRPVQGSTPPAVGLGHKLRCQELTPRADRPTPSRPPTTDAGVHVQPGGSSAPREGGRPTARSSRRQDPKRHDVWRPSFDNQDRTPTSTACAVQTTSRGTRAVYTAPSRDFMHAASVFTKRTPASRRPAKLKQRNRRGRQKLAEELTLAAAASTRTGP